MKQGEMEMPTSKADIKGWLTRGRDKGATHVIVACDTFDWDDYPVFVMPGQDAREIAKGYDGLNMQRLMEVYHLGMPDEEQLSRFRVMNFDLPTPPTEI
jgi:hypothetical protein